MPVLTVAYMTVAAGLLLGFGGAAFLAVLGSAALVVAAALRRALWIAALGMLGGASALLAAQVRAADQRCGREFAASGRARVRLSEEARPGGTARGTAVERGCRVRPRVSVVSGRAPSGALVSVVGEGRGTGHGVWIMSADLRVLEPPGLLARLRSRSGAAIERLYGARGAVAKALLIADESDISPEVRRQFSDAGIIHMISVSGLHVAVLAEAVVLLFLVAGAGVRRAEVIAVAVTGLFVLFVGAPAPAVRAGAMYASVIASRRLQRPTSPWALLALGAALPLVDPRLVSHIGYQLSVAGMAALIASGLLTRRIAFGQLPAWGQRLGRELLATVIACAVTAPIVAWHFGRLSLVAPLTNLAAAPLFALAQPALFLSLALSPLAFVAQFIADGTGVLLGGIERVALVGGRIPGAALDVMPSASSAVAVAVAAGALLVACAGRRWPRPVLVGAVAIALAVWWPLVIPATNSMELHVLDVGQGDAMALRTPKRRWIVIDAGDAWGSGDAGERTVAPFLRRSGGEVAAVILSHPHRDHIGGAGSLLRLLSVGALYDGGFVQASEGYGEVLSALKQRHVPWRVVRSDQTLSIDGVQLRILGPDAATVDTADEANDASVVVLAEFRGARILFTGDAERGEERMMVERYGDRLRADVLKVGHHGSATSSSEPFLDRVRPRLGLVSVGAGNHYGHPSADVLAELTARGVQVLRTDQVGSISIQFDGRRIRVRTGDETWELQGRR